MSKARFIALHGPRLAGQVVVGVLSLAAHHVGLRAHTRSSSHQQTPIGGSAAMHTYRTAQRRRRAR